MAGLNDIVPIQPVDLGQAYLQAGRLNMLGQESQLNQYKLAQAGRTEQGLQSYGQSGDVADLKGTPELAEKALSLKTDTLKLSELQQQQNLQQNERAAYRVLASDDPNDPSKIVGAWRQELDSAKASGRLADLDHATYSSITDPDRIRTAARGIIAQAQPPGLPKPGVTGMSPWGMQQYGIYDPVTQTTRTAPQPTAPGQPSSGSVGGNTSSLLYPGAASGEDFLKLVEANPQFGKAMADKIRNINAGMEPPPPPNPRPGSPGFIEDLLLHQAYPDFNNATWQARKRVQDSFTGQGINAKTNASAGTLIGHLDILRQLLPQLNNFNWGPNVAREYITGPLANLLEGRGEGSYSQASTKWDQTAHLAAKELAKITSGTGGTGEGEVAKLEAPFNRFGSNADLRGAIDNAISLMDSRLIEGTNQWNQAFGGTNQEMPSHRGWLDPQHQQVLNRIEGKTGEDAVVYSNPVANKRFNRDNAGQPDTSAPVPGKINRGPLPQQGQNAIPIPAPALELARQVQNGATEVTLPSGRKVSAQDYINGMRQKIQSGQWQAPRAPAAPPPAQGQ